MRSGEPDRGPGLTVGRVDSDQDTQERVLRDHLEWLRSQILPLLGEAYRRQRELVALKEKGRALAKRAYGVLLTLGMSEHDATKEIEKWRSSVESR